MSETLRRIGPPAPPLTGVIPTAGMSAGPVRPVEVVNGSGALAVGTQRVADDDTDPFDGGGSPGKFEGGGRDDEAAAREAARPLK